MGTIKQDPRWSKWRKDCRDRKIARKECVDCPNELPIPWILLQCPDCRNRLVATKKKNREAIRDEKERISNHGTR